MHIRLVEAADYEPIIAVVDQWWGGRRMAAMLPKLFFEHFRETSFVAESEGERVGFLIGFLSPSHPAEAYIHFVGVHPDYRKIGLGRGLYEHFFELVKRKGRHKVRCVTSPVNTNSIAFHRRLGFLMEPGREYAGDIPIHRHYDGPGEDRVLFVKEL
ncbi:MAG: GNAT family N-acetyltransferase [Thermodesulfobacteriota bacterium]